MTNLKIFINWIITVLLGSLLIVSLSDIWGLNNNSSANMLEWLFGGTFFLSMISGISSIPFILSLLIYNKINPISFKNWKSYFIHIHIIATLLNMFILVVLFNFSGNGNIEWLPVAYMILGIFTWFISIRKESKRQENKTIYPHLN